MEIAGLRAEIDKQLEAVSNELGGVNVLFYYSSGSMESALCEHDLDRFKSEIRDMDGSKGLAFILHTHGGSVATVGEIIKILHRKFGRNLIAVVPASAYSAGSMIALSCHRIIIGKNASLGPTDPQSPPFLEGLASYKEISSAHEEVMSAHARGEGDCSEDDCSSKSHQIVRDLYRKSHNVYLYHREKQRKMFLKSGKDKAASDEALKLFYDDPGNLHSALIYHADITKYAPGLNVEPMCKYPNLGPAVTEILEALQNITKLSDYKDFRVFLPFPRPTSVEIATLTLDYNTAPDVPTYMLGDNITCELSGLDNAPTCQLSGIVPPSKTYRFRVRTTGMADAKSSLKVQTVNNAQGLITAVARCPVDNSVLSIIPNADSVDLITASASLASKTGRKFVIDISTPDSTSPQQFCLRLTWTLNAPSL